MIPTNAVDIGSSKMVQHIGHSKNKCKDEGESLNKGFGSFSIGFGDCTGLKGFSGRIRKKTEKVSPCTNDIRDFQRKSYLD